MAVAVEGRFVKVLDNTKTDSVWDEDISMWKSHQVTAPTGFSDVGRGGAVFDPVRRVAIENSNNVNHGRDIFVTRLSEDGSGTNEVKRYLIPFRVLCKPVFDSERFVYFQANRGKQFGRLDLDTMAFETLADAPRDFGGWWNVLSKLLARGGRGRCRICTVSRRRTGAMACCAEIFRCASCG